MNNPFNPYGGYNSWPSQPVVFIPPQNNPQPSLADQIAAHLSAAETLKKIMKEDKGEKKDDKPKGGDLKVINVMLLMFLLSPITGPFMSRFFSWGLTMLPHP